MGEGERSLRSEPWRAGIEVGEGPPTYRVFVRCSFARYLAEWLLDAMLEYAGDPAEVASAPGAEGS